MALTVTNCRLLTDRAMKEANIESFDVTLQCPLPCPLPCPHLLVVHCSTPTQPPSASSRGPGKTRLMSEAINPFRLLQCVERPDEGKFYDVIASE